MKALALSVLAAALLAAPTLAAPAKTKAAAQSGTRSSAGITDPRPVAVPENPGADAAAAFLAQNAKAPGVITTASGLQYKVVHAGDPKGPSPKPGDAIKVHYEGKLLDGTVFDSSFARGKPMLAPLGGFVPAWMEALPMMHVGDEWTLYVPPALGYGPEGRGPIPANSVMVFRVQLLGMLSAD
jgi:FKBP-type peptidyl-prolyl cis-trans isomerase